MGFPYSVIMRSSSRSSAGSHSLSKLTSRLSLSNDELTNMKSSSVKAAYPPANFSSLICGCGSNMLGQINCVDADMTCTLLKPTLLPLDGGDVSVVAVSAGPQLSACVLQRREATVIPLPSDSEGASYVEEQCSNALYVWGSGLGQTFRQPTVVNLPKEKEREKERTTPFLTSPLAAGSIHRTLRGVVKVACGHSHIAVIDVEGHVWTWGDGADGKLGHQNRTSLSSPKLVAALSKHRALSVSCGGSHTAFVACERALFAEGRHRVVVSMTVRGSTGGSSSKTSSRASSSRHRALGTRLDDVLEEDEDEEGAEDTHGAPPPGGGATTASGSSSSAASGDDVELLCGDLYVCGLAKAGQLGLGPSKKGGSSSSFVATPTRVSTLDNESDSQGGVGFKIAKVSCGMHHTLVLAVAQSSWQTAADDGLGGGSSRPSTGTGTAPESCVAETAVFSCGYGEHGRLGLGDEDKRETLTRIGFPATAEASGGGLGRSFYNSFNTCGGGKDFFRSGVAPPSFTPTDVSAGEQHSLVSGKCGGAFAFGSNEYGQCGLGAPGTTEMALSPTTIPLPEGVHVRAIVAGGRHSGALTLCGKTLLFGWGDDAQCGQAEKSVFWPRPARLPRFDCDVTDVTAEGAAAATKGGRYATRPVDLALGMSHTLVLMKNDDHVPPAPKLRPVEVPAPVAVTVSVAPVEPAKVPTPPPLLRRSKSALLAGEDEEGEGVRDAPPAVRGIRELLAIRREEPEEPVVVTNQEGAVQEMEEEGEGKGETSFAFFMTEEF